MTNIIPLRRTHGATPAEWAHLALLVGEADLLPVVSRPGAEISPQSTLKGLGKTPSTYNQSRKVVGIPGWSRYFATAQDVDKWAKEPDHGICIQTRRVRGLDIDVPDAALADRIEAAFLEGLGVPGLPGRTRAGTGKRLLAFELVGDFPKRSFKVDGGLVEFLGSGQQFISIGDHFKGDGSPSGTRYEWVGGLPFEIPRVSQEAFERAWLAIVEMFALEAASEGQEGSDRSRPDLQDVEDPVVAYLDQHGLILGHQGEKVFVACPWKAGHTADSGISETCWLVAGSRGFEQGHFQCMHASCSKRGDADFLDECGYRTAAFVDLDADGFDGGASPPAQSSSLAGDEAYLLPWPKFKRDGKGAIEPTLDNVIAALARPDIIGVRSLRFDTFRDDLLVDGSPMKDAHAVEIRATLERRGFKSAGKELVRDALLVHAEHNQFDSAQDWLTGLPAWDGVERVETVYERLFGVKGSAYSRAVGAYTWTALAGRVMDPGCKVDMVVALQGPQGLRKSTAISLLAPSEEEFREINLDKIGDDSLSRLLRGCLVAELAELRGLRTKDAETIRAWIVQRHERWVPKFVERATSFARRAVLFASVNPQGFLDDEEGERRWLPLPVRQRIDTEALVAERDQLWAEGLVRWDLGGVAWQEAERLATAEHEAFKVRDEWTPRVAAWLEQEPSDLDGSTASQRGWVHLWQVAQGALGRQVSHSSRADDLRLARVLRALGWEGRTLRIDGKTQYRWVKG